MKIDVVQPILNAIKDELISLPESMTLAQYQEFAQAIVDDIGMQRDELEQKICPQATDQPDQV